MRTAYRCDLCGAAFSRPAQVRRSQRMPDGFRERQTFRVCPVCGAEETCFEDLRHRTPGPACPVRSGEPAQFPDLCTPLGVWEDGIGPQGGLRL